MTNDKKKFRFFFTNFDNLICDNTHTRKEPKKEMKKKIHQQDAK